MKIAKHLVSILALALSFQWSYAGSSDSKADGSNHSFSETTLKLLSHKNNHRPNAPSRSYIGCFYGEGFIEIVLPDGIHTMEVRVYNGDGEYAGTVSVDTPWIELPILSGIYDVECTSDDGRVFSGVIEW